jgi:hypothetical protein
MPTPLRPAPRENRVRTASAAKNNSENALLIEDALELAAQYLAHREDRWQRCQDWKTAYRY